MRKRSFARLPFLILEYLLRHNPPSACCKLWRRLPEEWRAEQSAFSAQVGEWLKPADCKSAPPSEVRRFESSPVHQFEALSGRERSGSPLPKSRASAARDLKCE